MHYSDHFDHLTQRVQCAYLINIILRIFCFYRFPVRDDLILSVDVKGKQPQPLPDAQASLSIHSDFVDDAIKVWDFLNNFR